MFWRHFYCLGAGKLVAHIFLCCILYFCIWFCVYVYLYLCLKGLQPARRSLYKCSCAGHRELGVRWRLPWLHLQNMRFTRCPKNFVLTESIAKKLLITSILKDDIFWNRVIWVLHLTLNFHKIIDIFSKILP